MPELGPRAAAPNTPQRENAVGDRDTVRSVPIGGRVMPRSVQFSRTGDPDVLEFVNDGLLSPGDDEVLIEVRAIGLNRADAMFRRGEYIFEPVLPAKLGTEAAGIVRGLGKGVTHVAVGDRVNLVPSFRMGAYGIYGDEIVVPGHAVIAQPEGLTFEQGACTWVMFLTAYGPLIEDARIQPGEHVVISAASSSVGLAAIQLANMVGAIPIALIDHVFAFGEMVEAHRRLESGEQFGKVAISLDADRPT
jgi:NADPH:quinone reductase-like Zn-dependent oxidoreductase